MRFLLLSILLIFVARNGVNAQVEVPFKVITKNYTTQKKESGISVKVLQGSSTVFTGVSDASSEVSFKLPAGKKYKVEVSKSGKVTRNFSIDLTGVNDEIIQGNVVPKGSIEMSLFEQMPGVDYGYVTSNVATEFYYDPAVKGDELIFDEILANKMRSKVDKIMKDAEEAKGQSEAKYNSLIKQADAAFTAKKYQEALTSYEQASALKPAEKYPAQRINEIDGILKAEKASAQQAQQIESEYQALVNAADNLFNQKKFEEAKARYQEALTKKQEQHPKDQIAKCDSEIARLKKEAENAQKYTDAIKAADGFFTQKSFQAAKDKYKEALKWKEADPYATGKLAEIDGKLNAQKAEQEKKKKYEDANAAADALFAQEKWTEAKVKYQEALAIEPASTYTIGRIKEIDAKLAEAEKEKAKQEQIARLLDEGNKAFTGSQWVPARTKYQEVLKLDASNATAAARITEIDAKIADEKANADKLAKIKQLVAEGDALVKTSKFPEAKTKYQEALALKADPAVQAKIDAVDAQILSANQKAEKKQRFDKAMADGEALFATSNWEEAKTKFQEALTIDGTAALPKQRIADTDKKIAESLANAQKAEKYAAAMAAGNTALAASRLPEARTKYQEAVALDGTKQEAKDKLAQVDKLIADEAAKNASKAKYDAAITAANGLLAANKLIEAKTRFEEAQKLDPSQALPKQKIDEINTLLANAEKQKQIESLLKEGDAALAKKELPAARAKYQQVLALDPSNAVAEAKIQEIAKLENEQAGAAQKEARFKQLKDEAVALMGQSKYAEARQKLNETKTIKTDAQVDQLIRECETKLAELAQNAEKDKQYNALIAAAQGLESGKQYDQAIAKYNEALKVKNEQLPKDRIAAINQLKANQANQAAQAKIDADYAAAIKRGDDLVAMKSYTDAIKAYNEALALKPTEREPVDKAAAAKALSDKETQTTEDLAYQKILDVGQKAIDEKNYAKAKEMYNRALGFRANDPLPKQKLAEVDALMKGEEDLRKKQTAYNAKIAEAENTAKSGNLQGAITLFEQAKTIKPDEVLPDNRIAELRAQLDGKTAAAQEVERRYTEYMATGNSAAAAKDYNGAIASYRNALNVKPKDKAAENKISEMQQLLDNAARADARQAEVRKLIAKADEKFAAGKWLEAKGIYESVIAIDQSNEYAKKQSVLCDQNENKRTGEEEDREYRKILTKADEKFDAKDYNRAKDLYSRALSFRAKDPYPKQRLAEIEAIVNPKPVVAEKEPEKLKPLGTETDNSIVEGETALQQAERIRKSRRYTKFSKSNESTLAKNDSLITAQKSTTTENNLILGNIESDNGEQAVASDEKRQENVHTLAELDTEIRNQEIMNNAYKTKDQLDAKSQIDAANRVAEEEGALLKTNAGENERKIKASRTGIEDAEREDVKSEYDLQLADEQQYMKVQLVLEENAIDDTQQRIDAEHIVSDASRSVIVVTEENQQRTHETLEAVKKEVDQVNITVSEKHAQEIKQSPVNKEELKKIESTHDERTAQENLEHLGNTMTMRGYVEDVDQEITDAVKDRENARQENAAIMQSTAVSQEELDRENYNTMMVKTLGTKSAITTETMNQEAQQATRPSVASAENVEKINRINDERLENERAAEVQQETRQQDNQSSLTSTVEAVEANQRFGAEQAKANEQILKESRNDIGATELAQAEKQKEKTQSAKQLLSAIEKKEIVYNEKVANDLGKLYPEGVSQEQFEQNDDEGLLKAIVTRRVVVKNGHGDIYTRIQTLSGLTYTKNGQPATEYVWQRETQDATLKRNY